MTRKEKIIIFFQILALIFLFALISGWNRPAYESSLDKMLQKEGITHQNRYRYRCTAGAHRGASDTYMENTAAALMAADHNPGYAFLEFDVQYAKDGTIVVYHDKRMLRLFGSVRKIGESSFAELSEISGGRIAAYDDVIGRLDKKVNIEIKSRGDTEEDERLADAIVADIRIRQRENDVMISSISEDVIRHVSRKYPGIPTGQVFWLTASTYLHFDGLTKKLYEDIRSARADYLMLHVANLRNIDDLLAFKPWGKTLVFWDFDDTMFIVHKDLSDRLWGDSYFKTFLRFLGYKLVSAFHLG